MQLFGETPPEMFFLNTTLTSSIASGLRGVSKHRFWNEFSSASFSKPSLSKSHTWNRRTKLKIVHIKLRVWSESKKYLMSSSWQKKILVTKEHILLWKIFMLYSTILLIWPYTKINSAGQLQITEYWKQDKLEK